MNVTHSAVSASLYGINQGFERLGQNSEKIANPNSGEQLQALVDNTLVEKQVQASTKALKTYDDMIGTLLDVTA
ncbi:hypothetical protein QCB44_04770 [Thiomicrorhabdus sp. zzn3]|uniref:hypothetical protein n=1 Tax=Thiomicrorhabdus sp. zzn3 TaxID=3039775 RepID=UPI002436746F|nr:hypothetical protein [Thiomicrorhabdus sp. zzn3]MDG6778018.1 hypothetical protein [Thiomicrorhabdus sp. zzn3]